MDLTDNQWAVLKPVFGRGGAPTAEGDPWRSQWAVLNGVRWVLRTGAPWRDLRSRYPPY